NAAIVIGALVPAAIMAIGAANLFASNIFAQFRPDRPQGEARIAKLFCLLMCAFALIVVLIVPVQFAIYFQVLGGAWMLQIFPAMVVGLYTRWYHPTALLIGWAFGMVAATWMAIATGFQPLFPLHIGGFTLSGFIALYALFINLAVTKILTFLFRAMRVDGGTDATVAADYA